VIFANYRFSAREQRDAGQSGTSQTDSDQIGPTGSYPWSWDGHALAKSLFLISFICAPFSATFRLLLRLFLLPTDNLVQGIGQQIGNLILLLWASVVWGCFGCAGGIP
jgi:hypothetical protein